VLPELGRRLTVHHGLLRSAFTGQANAILVRAELRVLESQRLVLNPRSFRRSFDLPPGERAYWAKERRVCQAVRVTLPEGRTGLLANLHATKRQRPADAELLRAGTFADALSGPDELCVLAGDFNVLEGTSRTLPQLRDRGFAGGGHGVDHILARGAAIGPVSRWPDERRRDRGVLLSDHAPVEARVA
jgi:endonuclease/exonuclease/phosphatase (EEP) superfamily protein YafD